MEEWATGKIKKMKDSEDYEKLPDTTVTRAVRRNRRLRYTAKPLWVEYPYCEAIGISRIWP